MTDPISKYDRYPETAVVKADEVQWMASQGWRIIEPVELARVIDVPRTVEKESYGSITSHLVCDSHLTRTTEFVMGRRADDPVSVLQAEVKTAKEEMHAAQAEAARVLRETGALIADAKATGEEIAADRAEMAHDLKWARDERDNLRKVVQRLEADIAKIRRAIGEDRMREITGEAKP